MPLLPRLPHNTYETYAKILKRVDRKPDRITNVFKDLGIDYDSMNRHSLHLIEHGLIYFDNHDILNITIDGRQCLQAFTTIEQFLTRDPTTIAPQITKTKITKKMWLDYLAAFPEDFEEHIPDSRPMNISNATPASNRRG